MNRDIIVVGASAGGIDALKQLVSGFPPDLPAAVFITLHLLSRSETILPSILRSSGPLQVSHPVNGEPIRCSHIYVAQPDYHLTFIDNHVLLGHGPKENLQRPSINVMFRSAADAFGPRVIGVVLSGLLDDGAAGLWEIHRKGGATIVQNPSDAAYRSMPESAIQGMDPDHIVPIADMRPLWEKLTQTPQEGGNKAVQETEQVQPIAQSCPVCGGAMERAVLGRMYEYRCHTGHRFAPKTMVAEKTSMQEKLLSAALAQTEELLTLLQDTKKDAAPPAAEALQSEIEAREAEARTLREMLQRQKLTDLGS